MVWKNPFQTKNSEEQVNERDFLSLFDSSVLQMIKEDNLSKVSFVSSTPGAGKTSLFRAFSSKVLNSIIIPEKPEEYRDIYKNMSRLGVISNNKVLLISALLSCALNYSIIDEMFQNGKRKQVFFALLNYRIAIVLLRNIGYLLDIDNSNYNRIVFKNIPDEMISEETSFTDGASLYQWACKGERDLCKYLDSDRNDSFNISFVHTSLMIIKLFEAHNIYIDGKQYFNRTLIIFDDFHKLSNNQKLYLSEAIYTLKSNVGIWFGQRFEGLNNEQIVSMDGSLKRDYNGNIIIDNYWSDSSKAYYNMLENIANRRVKESSLIVGSCHKFSDCILDNMDYNKFENQINKFINKIKINILSSEDNRCLYGGIIEHIDNKVLNLLDKAIWYECIQIKENRRNDGQLTFFWGEPEDLQSFEEFVNENEKGAKFYVFSKIKMPFYFGLNNLLVLSSYNVQQFLLLAGEYFECYRVKTLNLKRSQKNFALTAEEQMKVLDKVTTSMWNDMNLRYTNIYYIKNFLNNIAKIGLKSKNAEKNSYAGGAYTGIGISYSSIKQNVNNSKYSLLMQVLADCLASKYLERKEINNKEEIVVFYLNRWLCYYFKLPLAYGGWKKCNLDNALKMCSLTDLASDDDYQIKFE